MYQRQPTADNSGRRTVGVIAMRRLSVIVAIGLIVAVLVWSCGSSPKPATGPSPKTANGNVTVKSTETLKSDDVTNGGVAGTGHFTISGAIADAGAITDYRTVTARSEERRVGKECRSRWSP